MAKKIWIRTACIVLFMHFVKCNNTAITFSLSGGRLGDNLISYLHAKWVSFKYNIPLFCIPFENYDQFNLSSKETFLTSEIIASFQKQLTIWKDQQDSLFDQPNTLYTLPYFSEFEFDFQLFPHWPKIEIDWSNAQFKEIIKSHLSPKKAFASLQLPKNNISVAMHVRKGGKFDDPNTKNVFPLKIPSNNFYIASINLLLEIFKIQKLYIFIFTDDQNPQGIVNIMRKKINSSRITFDFRNPDAGNNNYILEDFFNMLQFDCLIRPQSNFSYVASLLKDYLVEISPLGVVHRCEQWIINQIIIKNISGPPFGNNCIIKTLP